MAFTQIAPNRSYHEYALYGICVIIAAIIASIGVNGRMEITAKDFIVLIGLHKFGGTSTFVRSARPIFTQIIRLLAGKNVQHQTGCNNVLGQMMIKPNSHDICLLCQEKKYKVH